MKKSLVIAISVLVIALVVGGALFAKPDLFKGYMNIKSTNNISTVEIINPLKVLCKEEQKHNRDAQWDNIAKTCTYNGTVFSSTTEMKKKIGPYITISTPQPGEIISEGTTVLISATVVDTYGANKVGVNKVEFRTLKIIDNDPDHPEITLLSTDTATPYEFSWDISWVSSGTYQIKITAFDNEGNTTDESVEIEIAWCIPGIMDCE